MNIGISDSSDSQDKKQKILFFTAKLDERARIIVPAPVRRKLGISFGAVVFVGVEKVKGGGNANVPEKDGGNENESNK